MCSPGVTARDRVLAELAALGPAAADAFRPGATDAVTLLGQVRELAGSPTRCRGSWPGWRGRWMRSTGWPGGLFSTAGFLRHGCGRSPGRAGGW